jgi:hypothetical protein
MFSRKFKHVHSPLLWSSASFVGYSYNKLFNQNHDGLASENLTHMIVIGDYHRTLVEHPKKDERNNPSLGSFVFGCYLVAHPT